MQYGIDPRLIVGDEVAESEVWLGVLVECQAFLVKEQERRSRSKG